MKSLLVTPLLPVLVFIGAWALGELSNRIGPAYFIVAAFFLLTTSVIGAVELKPRKSFRFLMIVTLVAAFLSGSTIGITISSKAAFECQNAQDNLRKALTKHFQTYRKYPHSLEELDLEIPGGMALTGSVLSYTPTERGYLLSYSDGLYTFEATEKSDFVSNK